ncbi:MAG: helix-turn-helix domain-containing protein [Alloacidobacterium sp.]
MTSDNTKAEQLTLSVPEAGKMVNLGKNAAYAAARAGQIPTLRFGRKLRVPTARFLKMLSEGCADQTR